MSNRVSPDLATRMRTYTRRVGQRITMDPNQRLNMQVAHTPLAVLGASRRTI
ncbi:MAG: hypothetical protein QM774_04310 [Gordonia sp. (in: high G+C Gram-positive bacteria)]|uniref:hypothetical protein n=1 Tax=Gordonia sp. (in: high G+C Gram-positive bacteria) TaxID=84139 RepID=UPI0039E2C95E